MDSDVSDELRALRSRAYGRDADIHDDPQALRRLRELEMRGQTVSPSSSHDPAAISADSSEEQAVLPTVVTDLPQAIPHARSPRTIPLLWVASVLVAILVTALTSTALIQRGQADLQQAGATQVARLGVEPGLNIPESLGGAGAQAFAEFHGLRIVLSPDAYLGEWYDGCLQATTSEAFDRATDDLYSGPVFTGCAADPFPAAVSAKVTSEMPEELREEYPEGTALQFVFDEPVSEVVVFSSADFPAPSESTTLNWPEGSSADSPECQDASAAVVEAANAVLTDPNIEGSQVDWLSAHPDPELGHWLLTGLLPSTGTEGGYFVMWATKSDPTTPDFEGDLFSLGISTSISSAPPMTPAYVGSSDMDDVPQEALGCGSMH